MKRRDFIVSASAAGIMIPVLGRAATPCPPPELNVSGGTTASTPCVPGVPGTSYTTNFLGVENPISEGGRWSNNGLDWTPVMKSNGLACGTLTGAGGYEDSYAKLSGFPANHSASGVILLNPAIDVSCTHEVELLLRWSDAPHIARGYECLLSFTGGCQIVRWNGAIGDFTNIGSGGPDVSVKTGDVFKATIVGNVITAYLNNTQIGQATDSTYATGNPGIGFFRRACGSNSDFGYTSFTAAAL
jgi:hypothetical protein